MPPGLIDDVGLIGSEAEVRSRIAAYPAAGASEICIVEPAPDLPSPRRTLELLRPV